MHRKQSSTSPQKCLALVREERSLELRIKGKTYQEIADELGITKQGVGKALHRSIEKHRESCIENVEHHRIIELERLEIMLREWMPKALDVDEKPSRSNDRAANVVLKIMKRKAELLGLDAPKTESLNVNAEGNIDQINIVFVKPKE